jgi:hypothetical protein
MSIRMAVIVPEGAGGGRAFFLQCWMQTAGDSSDPMTRDVLTPDDRIAGRRRARVAGAQ